MLEQLELLRNLVIRYLKQDPRQKSRLREVVDAKKIFCLVAFNEVEEFRYVQVSSFLGMNHATIIHHVKSAKDLLNYDPYFKEKYKLIENNFFILNQEVSITDIESEIHILLFRLNKLKEKKEKYLANEEKSETLTQEKKPLVWMN